MTTSVLYGALLACRENLHWDISLLRGNVEVFKTNLTTPYLLNCHYQTGKVSGHVCMCARNIDFASFYSFSIVFCNCSDSVVFCNCSDSVVF